MFIPGTVCFAEIEKFILDGHKKSHVVSSFMKKENRKITSTDSFLNVIGLHVDLCKFKSRIERHFDCVYGSMNVAKLGLFNTEKIIKINCIVKIKSIGLV